jgi:hypothetical protein
LLGLFYIAWHKKLQAKIIIPKKQNSKTEGAVYGKTEKIKQAINDIILKNNFGYVK